VHAGVVDVKNKHCEDCGLKHASFGLPTDRKNRWCAGCAKVHAGAVDMCNKHCEDCGLKQAAFGLPTNRKKRWYAGCAKEHVGAVDVKNKKHCEDCGLVHAAFGLLTDRKKRWCGGCAKEHAEGVQIYHTSPQKRRHQKIYVGWDTTKCIAICFDKEGNSACEEINTYFRSKPKQTDVAPKRMLTQFPMLRLGDVSQRHKSACFLLHNFGHANVLSIVHITDQSIR
jgi:hypothetical protein